MPAAVSINLCCYNSEKYLRETLDSVVNQTYKDWELIIINDGSKDATESIIDEYTKQGYPITYCYQENKGLGYSRNKAIEHSSGEYIAFIDHDDIWMPDKLERQLDRLKSRPAVDFVYSNYFKMTSYGKTRLVLGLKGKQPEGFVFFEFIHKYLVFISTVVVTKKALLSLDLLFDERFNQIEELDVFLRLLYTHQAAYIRDPLAVYRIHSNMTTIKSPELVPKEVALLIEKIEQLDPLFRKKYPLIMDFLEIQIVKYNKAKYEILCGNLIDARNCVAPYKWYSVRLFLAYVATFLPHRLVSFINQNILLVKRVF
jgi:glycosyltransferase involved in cell wall biosynthesis